MNFKSWLLSEEEEKDINLSNPNLTSTIPPLNTSVSNPKLTTTIPPLNANLSNPNLTNTKIYKLELASNQKVKALAIEYIKAKGFAKLPIEFKNFLHNKRKAYKGYKKADGTKNSDSAWYPSDIEVAEKNGLPNNWMDSQIEIIKSKNEQKSNDRLEELAIYYGKNGASPSKHTSDKKDKSLALWLINKKRNPNPHEESDDITWADMVALSKNWNKEDFPYELPGNWREIKPAGEKSLGEKLVANILKELEIENDTEHRDDACKNKICLPFDFSITHNGKKYLEFHGGQHYYPVYFGSTEEKTDQEIAKHALDKFEYIQGNDKIKYDHCVKENLPFLVIPYWLYETPDIIKSRIKQFLETNEFNETFAIPNVPSDYKVKHDKIYENFLAKSKPAELNPTELVYPTKTFEQFLINKIL